MLPVFALAFFLPLALSAESTAGHAPGMGVTHSIQWNAEVKQAYPVLPEDAGAYLQVMTTAGTLVSVYLPFALDSSHSNPILKPRVHLRLPKLFATDSPSELGALVGKTVAIIGRVEKHPHHSPAYIVAFEIGDAAKPDEGQGNLFAGGVLFEQRWQVKILEAAKKKDGNFQLKVAFKDKTQLDAELPAHSEFADDAKLREVVGKEVGLIGKLRYRNNRSVLLVVTGIIPFP